MNQLIGFATQFYTLWSVEKVPIYVTDSNGKHWLARVDERYTYHKNISTSLDRVKELYPTLTIDDELRGKTISFEREGKNQLPDHTFWRGKYAYQLISDVAKTDWEYVLWVHDVNMGNHASHIETLPQWDEHKAKLEAEAKQKKEEADAVRSILPIGQPITIHGLSNGFNLVQNYGSDTILRVTFKASVDGIDNDVWVHCSDAQRVYGMYNYIMPIVNGNAQKTKNKTIIVTPTGLNVGNRRIEIWIDPLTSEYGPTISY